MEFILFLKQAASYHNTILQIPIFAFESKHFYTVNRLGE